MRVEIVRRPGTLTVDVYVVGGRGEGSYAIFEDGRLKWSEPGQIAPGEQVPAAVSLEEDFLAALLDAAADVVKPSRAVIDHLADTIVVRDRLLALVEAGFMGRAPGTTPALGDRP